jgi:hypothetical protein
VNSRVSKSIDEFVQFPRSAASASIRAICSSHRQQIGGNPILERVGKVCLSRELRPVVHRCPDIRQCPLPVSNAKEVSNGYRKAETAPANIVIVV